MLEPPPDGNDFEDKIKRWMEEGKLQNSIDKELTAFHRTIHKVNPIKIVYLKKGSVRDTFSHLYKEYNQTGRYILCRTVGEITEAVNMRQSTVTKAIQELEEAPVVVRMPHPGAKRDNVIAVIPPIFTHIKEAWDTFEQKATIPAPPINSRAAGIIAAYERHVASEDPFEVNNNIELWYQGELMGITPNTDLNIKALKNENGLLDVEITPATKENICSKKWEQIKNHSRALTQGLAKIPGYNPETGEYLSSSEAHSCVVTPSHSGRRNIQRQRWIIDLMDTKH